MKLTDVLRSKSSAGGEVLQQVQPAPQGQEEVRRLPIHLIKPSQYQPRVEFDEQALDELARSINEHGILHPVVVRKSSVGYELIVGERRLRACQRLGWDMMPAIVREMTDNQAAELALIENLQRKDLRMFEEAEGYRRLLDDFGLTQDELAKRLGKGQSSIANKLRLLHLSDQVREIISREMLSERHARALLKLNSEADQLRVLEKVIQRGLNVRETEQVVEKMISQAPQDEKVPIQRRKLILKDLRLFKNSVKKLTDALESSGLDVDFQEREHEDAFELLVIVKKPQGGER